MTAIMTSDDNPRGGEVDHGDAQVSVATARVLGGCEILGVRSPVRPC